MINWVIGLFLAALVAAFFGFGGVATTFAATAQLLFFVFLTLFLVSAIVAMFGARVPGIHTTVRTLSLVVLVAAVSIGAYAWIENDMSAERLGRSIDRETVELAGEAGDAWTDATGRTQTFVSQTVNDMRDPPTPDETSPQQDD